MLFKWTLKTAMYYKQVPEYDDDL